MGNFEEYIQKDRQELKQQDEMHDVERKYGYIVEKKDRYSAEDDMERMHASYASTSYAERMKYYFMDHNMLRSKAEKYEQLGLSGDKTLNRFAKAHTNHSARKRKKRSREAAALFRQAAAKEETVNKRQSDNKIKGKMEAFQLQSEIMELRLKGMLKTAYAKSTDKNDENYRGAKAKLKCYTLLYEQAGKLDESAKKEQILESLDQKIASAKQDMLKYGANRQATKKLEIESTYRTEKTGDFLNHVTKEGDKKAFEIRKEIERKKGLEAGNHPDYKSRQKTNADSHGDIINPKFDDKAYEIYKGLRVQNQQLDHPDLKFYFSTGLTFRKYIQEISRMGGAMLRQVKYDEKWQPVSEEDKMNHTFNLKVAKQLKDARDGNEDEAEKLDEEMQKESIRFATEGPALMDPARIENELIKPYKEALEYNKTHKDKKDLSQINAPVIEDLLANPGAYAQMAQRGLLSDALVKVFPA